MRPAGHEADQLEDGSADRRRRVTSIAELWSLYEPAEGSWRLRAACAGKPQAWWFPPRGGDQRELALAKAICRTCPVRVECLRFALDQEGPISGVWGGLSEAERRRRRSAGPVALSGVVEGLLEDVAAGEADLELGDGVGHVDP